MDKKETNQPRQSIMFAAYFIILLALLLLLTSTQILNSLLSDWYALIVIGLLFLISLSVVFGRRLSPSLTNLLKGISYLLLLPLALIPLVKCYFKIPYLFCHACPSRCAFGTLRTYILPSALLINIDKKAWCTSHCPFGRLQDTQKGISKKRIPNPNNLRYLPYLILVAVIISYVITLLTYDTPLSIGNSIINTFFKGTYSISALVLAAMCALLMFAIILRRPFCRLLCPIGTASDLGAWCEARLPK